MAAAAPAAAAKAAHPYLISKVADPLFALFIGSSAAFVRVRREQKEKFPDQPNDVLSMVGIGRRRVERWWKGEFDS